MKSDILSFIEEKQKLLQDMVFEDQTDCRITTGIALPLMLVNKVLTEKKEKIFAGKYALTSSEFEVLISLLALNKRLTPTELYENMIFSSGGMTKILNKLESKKLIKRVDSQQDKRSRFVEITPKGVQLAKAAFKEAIAFHVKVFDVLDEDEKIFLEKILKKMFLAIMSADV